MDIKTEHIIIFDFDGTLTDVTERWYKLHTDLSEKYGVTPYEKKEYINKKNAGIPEQEIMKESHFKGHDLALYLKERIDRIEEPRYLQFDMLKSGAIELLTCLQKHHPLILLTKRRIVQNAHTEIENMGIQNFFRSIWVTGEQTKEEWLRNNLDAQSAKNAVMVGDTIDDYKTALIIGIPCILVSDGTRNQSILQTCNSEYIFDNLVELKSFLCKTQ